MVRIEVTTHDVSFFRHYRQVEHRNGNRPRTSATSWMKAC
jgi:hypothetical protein